jgi:hypothetical protein
VLELTVTVEVADPPGLEIAVGADADSVNMDSVTVTEAVPTPAA